MVMLLIFLTVCLSTILDVLFHSIYKESSLPAYYPKCYSDQLKCKLMINHPDSLIMPIDCNDCSRPDSVTKSVAAVQ